MVLQFHQQIIADLLEDPNGGLVILSSGLSLPRLISSLLFIHYPSQGTFLILSPHTHSPSLKSQILHHLSLHFPESQSLSPSEITADLSVHHRHSLYSSVKPFFITPHILIVDLLTQKLPPSSLVDLLTQKLPPSSLADLASSSSIYVLAKTEKTIKCLFIKRLLLWPRSQVNVSEVMDACLKEMKKTNKVDVEDLTVENGLFNSFDEIVRRQLDPI